MDSHVTSKKSALGWMVRPVVNFLGGRANSVRVSIFHLEQIRGIRTVSGEGRRSFPARKSPTPVGERLPYINKENHEVS